MSVDARKEEYQEVELFGKPALFTNSRIERNTVPDGWFCYDLRGSDYDPGRPVTIESHVVVNHAGSILTHEPVKFRNEQTSRRLRDGLNFTGDIISLADFCEDHELAYPPDTSKYMLRPASPEEAGLFYAHSLDEEKTLGCVGNVRIDFGHRGQEFWHTWWPSYDTALNTPEFKAELQELVDELRTSVLKNLSGMNSYCYEHGGLIDGGYQQNYGYVAETDSYRYCLRCTPVQGDYNAYLYAYDKRQQELNMKNTEKPIIARTSYANGEVFEHTDPEAFLTELREELQYRNSTGFHYEVLTDDPAVRKAVDDELYNLFGEENPRQLEDYGLTEQGRKALRDAENPNLPHGYKWFVVENFGCDGETRHDTDSLTGAIDSFNGLDCEEKRLCVTKDDVSTIYLAITHDGETHIDDGWQENPRFATDSTMDEAMEGVYVLPTANNNAIISGILQDSYSTLSEVLGMSNQIQTSDELSGTALSTKTNITPNGDYTNRRWQFATQRWNYDTANSHMISAIGCPTIAAWLLPNTDIFPHIQLSNVAVGLGDGEKTVFNCPLPLVVENSEAIRVDGVLQTREEDYTFVHDNNAAEYPELFISADPKNCEVSGGYTHTSYYYYPFLVWGEYYKGKNCISSSSPILFDYGHAIAVNRIVIPTSSFYFGGWGSPSTNAVISYSQDNETWTDILTAETALYSSVHADVTLETPVTARYWRLSVSSATQLGGGSCPNIRLGYVTPGIVFTNPPAAGAAIEMDCKLDRPIKNENWVLDFSFAVQFERS